MPDGLKKVPERPGGAGIRERRNYRLSQKLKLLGYGEFNHLTNILTLTLTCGLRLPLNEWGPTREIFNFLNGR
jgi:hypothetical protein